MPLLYGRLLHPRPALKKLQVMQNAALRTATGCTQDTNIQHLHDETITLPIHEHLQLHASQDKHTTYFNTPRLNKPTIFNNGHYTTNIPTDPHTVTTPDIKTNMRFAGVVCCLTVPPHVVRDRWNKTAPDMGAS